jgi:hypothetical protein
LNQPNEPPATPYFFNAIAPEPTFGRINKVRRCVAAHLEMSPELAGAQCCTSGGAKPATPASTGLSLVPGCNAVTVTGPTIPASVSPQTSDGVTRSIDCANRLRRCVGAAPGRELQPKAPNGGCIDTGDFNQQLGQSLGTKRFKIFCAKYPLGAHRVSPPLRATPKTSPKWPSVFDQTACNRKRSTATRQIMRIHATVKTTRHRFRRLLLRHLRHLHRHSTSLMREAV